MRRWMVVLGCLAGSLCSGEQLEAQKKRDTVILNRDTIGLKRITVSKKDTVVSKLEEFAELYGELMVYNEAYGPLFSLEELAFLPGYDSTAVEVLGPYVRLWLPGQQVPFRMKELVKKGKSMVLLRAKAGSSGVWTPGTSLFYKFSSSNRLQWGLTLDQDAQERFFTQGRAVDFTSFHVQVNRLGPMRRLILGDYTVRFGQGLVAWNGFSMGGLGPVQGLRRGEPGIAAYSGGNEWLFFRGAAVMLDWRYWRFTLFGSAKKVDARITADGFTSLPQTGLHRTDTELEKRLTMQEYVAGGNASVRVGNVKLGYTALAYSYNQKNAVEVKPYNRYQSRRLPFGSMSVDGLGVWGTWRAFGEFALDARGKMAGLAGLLWDAGDGLEAGILYRNYSKAYTAPYAGAYSRNSKPFNEHALLGSLEFAWKRWRLLGSGEWCYFPWLRYNVAAPSHAAAAMLQLSRNTGQTGLMYVKVDYKYAESGNQLPLSQSNRMGLRLHLQYGTGRAWLFAHRMELCGLKSSGAKLQGGAAFYTDAIYTPDKGFSGSARLCVFKTLGWATRLYAYERDAIQGFSFPPIYGYGLRGYLNLRYTLGRHFDFWLRGACTRYLSATHPSTSAKPGRSLWDYDIKLQLRVVW